MNIPSALFTLQNVQSLIFLGASFSSLTNTHALHLRLSPSHDPNTTYVATQLQRLMEDRHSSSTASSDFTIRSVSQDVHCSGISRPAYNNATSKHQHARARCMAYAYLRLRAEYTIPLNQTQGLSQMFCTAPKPPEIGTKCRFTAVHGVSRLLPYKTNLWRVSWPGSGRTTDFDAVLLCI